MLHHNRAALLLALTPTLACRMLYISGEQGESNASGPSASGTETSNAPSMTEVDTSSAGLSTGDSQGLPDSTMTNFSSSDTAASTSSGPYCGDGFTDPGEECDGGDDCDPLCKFLCGNGKLDRDEQCDEGDQNEDVSDQASWPFCTRQCKRYGRYVFITSKGDFTGKLAKEDVDNPLAGVEAADVYCTEVAKNLPESRHGTTKFIAWISASTNATLLSSPSGRIGKCTRPFYLPKAVTDLKRVLVATSYSDLSLLEMYSWDVLKNPINRNELGDAVLDASVLTATNSEGNPNIFSQDCSHWTKSSNDLVWAGNNKEKNILWTDTIPHLCSEKVFHLYCFEQCPP